MTPAAFALSFSFTFGFLVFPQMQQSGYKIPEARMVLDLPNQNWHLADHSGTSMVRYIFKRDPVEDSAGNRIIPAIMVFVEDASSFKGDLVTYSIIKRAPFMEKGVKVDTTLFPMDKGYPVAYRNSLFMKCSYSDNGGRHVLYMIHIITKADKGVMVYLDMTTGIEKEYLQEFWKTIRSIRESSD